MNRIGVVSVVLISLLFVMTFVSAQNPTLNGIADGVESFYDTLFEPFAKFLLGQSTDSPEAFFAKLLVFIIVLSVVWFVVGKFPLMTGKKKTGLLIAVVVSILSVRYLTYEWLNTIILPYTTLGVAVTSLIPFIIYFFFVKDLPTQLMRKSAWIFFAVVFFGLFIFRINGPTSSPQMYVYLVTVVLSLIMFSADGTIQRALDKAMYKDLSELKKVERRAGFIEEYDKIQSRYNNRVLTKLDANKLIASLKSRATAVGIDPNLFTAI